MGMLVVLLGPNQFLHQIPLWPLRATMHVHLGMLAILHQPRPGLLTPHNRRLKPQPQTNRHPLIKRTRQRLPILLKVKLCQEPQTPQRKAQHRRDNPLKQPTRIQHRPVPAEGDDKVKSMRSGPAHALVPEPQPLDHVPARLLAHLPGRDIILPNLLHQPGDIKPLVLLQLFIHVDRIPHIPLLVQQPPTQLPRLADQLHVVYFCQQENGLDSELEPHAPQPPAQFAHAPGHFGELFLCEQARVGRVRGGGAAVELRGRAG